METLLSLSQSGGKTPQRRPIFTFLKFNQMKALFQYPVVAAPAVAAVASIFPAPVKTPFFLKTLPYLKILLLISTANLLLLTPKSTAQIYDNQALAFDGIGDYIELSPLSASFQSNPVLTAEAWFYANAPGGTNCVSGVRRLFSFTGGSSPATFSLLDIGLCNGGQLHYYYRWGTGGTFSAIQIASSIVTNAWHHLAVTYAANSMQVYLDGVLINTVSIPANVAFEFNTFRVGYGGTPSTDWEGQVDEIRLWNKVRTLTEIKDTKDCSLLNPPGLVANWTLNQPTTPFGPNPSSTVAVDMSLNGNDGALINFDLLNNTNPYPNSVSNFVLNACPPLYSLDITDLGSQSISLASLCSGNGAHFCVNQNGVAVQGFGGAMVEWQYFDVGSSTQWNTVTGNPFPNNFCFGVQTLDISAICATSTTGYVDRKYRAIITKGAPGQPCSYITSEHLLRIHCPVTNAALTFAPPIPNPPNVALCEGTSYTTAVSLNSTDAFVPSGLTPNGDLGIQWCIDGVPVSPANVATLPFTGTATAPDLCFEAKVVNGVCPLLSAKTCIPVDKVPMCGAIGVTPELAIMSNPATGPYDPYDYLICPGNDAELMMLVPTDFKDCDAVWQIMFPVTQPGVWHDLNGIGNPTQNTGTLPQWPPNPSSTWTWPAGETCIVYRIECRPKHHPFSDCAPCHSNEVEICLKQEKPAPVIAAAQNPICAPNSTTLTVSPYDPGCTYTWYCDGSVVATNVQTYTTGKPACYWVEVFDGCFIQTSNPLQLNVCEVVPVIECPQDNPCACLGVPITLTSSIFYNNCGITGLQYSWTASSGTPLSGTGPQFVHDPDPLGTTYTLTVTDPNDPSCSWTSKPLTIEPCQ
jgi:hypothetical protein